MGVQCDAEGHDRGPVIFATENIIVFACHICDCLAWELRGDNESGKVDEKVVYKAGPYEDDGRCNGITILSRRCKLPAVVGYFCLTHRMQAEMP